MKSSIWYEKYRQTDIDKLSLPKNVKMKMSEFIEAREIPHLLFTGPPGSGKTTLSRILIDNCASSTLELNGSSKEDRGINTIKTKVGNFARSLRKNKDLKNIIFFDEADGLTTDAQKALKSMIEINESNTRFIFAANDFSAINEAIYSRCMHFSFQSIPKIRIEKYCRTILKAENIKAKREDIQTIIDKFYPDIRSVLNNLQYASIGNRLKVENLIDEVIDFEKLSKLINAGKIGEIRNLWKSSARFNWLWKFLFDEFIPNIEDKKVIPECAFAVGEYMHKDNFVADREINASVCLIDIMVNLGKKVYF